MKPDNDMYNSQGYSVAKGGYPDESSKDDWILWLGLPFLVFSFIWHHPDSVGVIGDMSHFLHDGGNPPDQMIHWAVILIMAVTISHVLLWPGSWLMDLPDEISDIPEERSTRAIFNASALAATAGLFSYVGLADNDWLVFIALGLFALSAAVIAFNTVRQMGLFCFLECAFWGLLICITLNAIFGDKDR